MNTILQDHELAGKLLNNLSPDASTPLNDAAAGSLKTRCVDSVCFSQKEDAIPVQPSSLSCPKCFDLFKNESKYADHVLTHSPWYIMYVCGVCGLTLEEKDLLVKHIISHITPVEEPSSNDHWESDSDSDFNVSLIDLKRKAEKRKKFQCKKCSLSFDDRYSYNDHLKNHKTICTEINEKKYSCDSCNLCFPTRRKLEEHIRAQHPEEVLICDMCQRKFNTRREITRHLSKHLRKLIGKPIKCAYCDKVFNKKNTLRYHERKYHNRNPPLYSHVCGICQLPCVSKSRLVNHMRVHTGERPYLCPICEKSFSHSGSLAQHLKTHDERKHVCSVCSSSFTRRTHLMNHMSTHSGQKPFVCAACGKTFAYSVTLKMHMRTHSGEKPHKCTECSKAFVRRDQLTQHLKVHTRERPFVCEKCGKGFAHRAALKVHTWREHSEDYSTEELGPCPIKAPNREDITKTHVCSTCGKTFLTRAELSQHSVVHSGVKPYHCQTCGKSFARKSGLTLHDRVHTGEKPYLCITCGRPFSTQSGLRTHVLLVHSGEKPHACPTCGKGFPTKDRLVVHIRFHTGEKPFVCRTCGKGFTRSDNLKAHIRTHSGQRPFPCLMCDRAFYNKCELVKHFQTYPNHEPSSVEYLKSEIQIEQKVQLS